jgi:hypothetical protein
MCWVEMSWANITNGSFFLPSNQSVQGLLKSSPSDFIVQEIPLDQRILQGQDVNFNPTPIPRIILKPKSESVVASRSPSDDTSRGVNVIEEVLIIEEREILTFNEYQKIGEQGLNSLMSLFSHFL